MCRLLAYLGAEIQLSRLLLDPEHSLEKQAWQPKELREAKLNADGFGFAWYNDIEHKLTPACYRNTLPIWNDSNLRDLSGSLHYPLWIAYIRSATTGLGVSLQNTQPFIYQQWTFIHNGYILDFRGELQHKMNCILDDEFLYLIKGNTDSEYIFALLMQLLQTHSPPDAFRQCISIITDIIQDKRALLNICISDGNKIYTIRHAVHGLCPSLYYTNTSNEFGHGNQIIVSEKLNSENCWQAIDDHKLFIISSNSDIEIYDI